MHGFVLLQDGAFYLVGNFDDLAVSQLLRVIFLGKENLLMYSKVETLWKERNRQKNFGKTMIFSEKAWKTEKKGRPIHFMTAPPRPMESPISGMY